MPGTPLSASEIILLQERYPNERTEVIARELGRSIKSVYGQAHLLGLHKSREFILSGMGGGFVKGRSYGLEFRFKKGHKPFNKGMKGMYTTRNSGQFKKGNQPSNTQRDGCISIRKDSHTHPYKFIRLAKGKWQFLHRYTWEQHHGYIPNGMIITFIDGDSMNCDISNLRMISRAEHCIRNHNLDKSIAKIKSNYRINPDSWYTNGRLSYMFGISRDSITGEVKGNLIAAAKLKRTIRHAKSTNRNARNAKAA